ncbi:MAG: hybrid sensor histidine kinase/response regulator [Deltaproteobacteria bacterium]|nr:hybrid sensor histidine kinase/response regulator [Deltaproteobacteria bacterium]
MSAKKLNQTVTVAKRKEKPAITRNDLREETRLSEFIHKFCHEIDNPLTSIISLASLVQQIARNTNLADDFRKKIPSYCVALSQEAWRIAALVEELLFILSAREDCYKGNALNDILCSSLAKIRDDESYQQIETTVTTPTISPIILMNEEQLRYVIDEVLNNAHYAALHALSERITDDNNLSVEPIQISVTQKDNRSVVSVKNPIRCPKHIALEKLFEPFVSTYQDNKHPGLGLAAVMAILERAGGSIQLEEEHLEGGSFSFCTRIWLPTANVTTVVNEVETQQSTLETLREGFVGDCNQAAQEVSVLIIEDDQTVSSAIKKIIEFEGISKRTAECTCVDHAQAFSLLTAGETFDAILCDLNLAGTSGRHIYESICQNWPNQKKHFAFITGDSYNRETQAYLKSCKRPFLHKPFEHNQLTALVAKLIEA